MVNTLCFRLKLLSSYWDRQLWFFSLKQLCFFFFVLLVGRVIEAGRCHSCLSSKRASTVLVHLWHAYDSVITTSSLLCFQPFDCVTHRAFVFTIAYHQLLASNFVWLELIPVVFGLFSWFLNNPKVKWFQAFSVLMIIHDFTHLKRVLLVFLTGCGLWYGCWSTFNCATSSIMCAKRLTVWYAQSKSKLIAATIWLAIWLASWLHPYSLCLLSIQFLIACSMHTVDGGKVWNQNCYLTG